MKIIHIISFFIYGLLRALERDSDRDSTVRKLVKDMRKKGTTHLSFDHDRYRIDISKQHPRPVKRDVDGKRHLRDLFPDDTQG